MDARDYRLGYRGDIEGLRAIAILLVVAAHAKVPWLTGGFVGVDVFFVLSGYLITGLLLREIGQSGNLRFANFYARRFRRLLPALLFMLIGTAIGAAIALPPAAQGDQAIAGATAAVWLSNFHFAFAKIDYFSPGAASNLFLHTWSLGVEEQFYLVWPALMTCMLLAWRSKGGYTRRLKIAMFAIVATSLACCLVLTDTSPQATFYLMPLRAWQFGVGALVWLYFGSATSDDTSPSHRTAWIHRWLGWSGLGLIVGASLWFDTSEPYPGWRALLPTAGAAAVIFAGVRGAEGHASRLLSWHPLQLIGRVSYSWYLWHWPVLLLGGVLVSDTSAYRAAWVIISLLLAVASYRWVETPIRRQSRWTARPGITVLTALGMMVAANVMCILWLNATSAWKNSPAQRHYAMAHADVPIIYAMGCDDWYTSDRVHICTFGPGDAKHTAVLMGDSIGAQWFPAIAPMFHRPDWRLLVVTKSSCPMVDEPIFYERIGREYVECNTWRAHALQQIAALQPDVVFLGSVQTYAFTQAQWVDGTRRVLKAISPASGHVFLIRGTPELPFDGPGCLSRKNWLPQLHVWSNACHAPASSHRDDLVDEWLKQASSSFDNVTSVDMSDAVCPNGECEAERDGMVVYRDAQHLTATFVRSIAQEFEQQVASAHFPPASTLPDVRNAGDENTPN